MLNSVPVSIFVGSVLGFLSGLGVGGGSLLILWLNFVLHLEQAAARNINLLFFLPAALISTVFRWKQSTLNLGYLWPALITGPAAVVGFTVLADRMDTSLLQKLFGALLLITGTKELLFKEKNPADS